MLYYTETNQFLKNSQLFYTIAIGMDSRYSYVSNNYNRNFSFLNQTLLGELFSVTLHPDDVIICSHVGKLCFENPGTLFPATLRKHDGKGGFVITQWEMKAMFDADNKPYGIFCLGYNITEHVDTRAKLADAKTEIVSKQDQLVEIGFIQSHVVRKPLANIMGILELLATMDIDPDLNNLRTMLLASATELDLAIKNISGKIN